MRVMEQSMVTISPWKGLGPDAEVWVGDELGSLLLSVVRLQENIQHAHSHPRERDEIGEGLPHAS